MTDVDPPESDRGPRHPNTLEIHLVDGPLAGTVTQSPARVVPPMHILVLAEDPSRVRPGPNPPSDPTGWLLYSSVVGRATEFEYRGPVDGSA